MNRFIILIKVGLSALFFYFLGYILHYIFRTTPQYVIALIFILVIGGIIFLILKKNKKFKIENPRIRIPDYLDTSIIVYILIGGLIGYFLSASEFRTILYVDNGSDKTINVKIPNNEEFKLLPNKYKQTSVPIDDNVKILIDGKPKVLKIDKAGNWVYNFQNLNKYLETSIDYLNASTMYDSSKADSILKNDTLEKNTKIIGGELFRTDASYLFEPPSEITTNSKVNNTRMTIKVLYKIPK